MSSPTPTMDEQSLKNEIFAHIKWRHNSSIEEILSNLDTETAVKLPEM